MNSDKNQPAQRLRLLLVTTVMAAAILGGSPLVSASAETDAANATAAATAAVAIIPALLNSLGPALVTFAVYGMIIGLMLAIPALLYYMFTKQGGGLFKHKG